MSSGAQNARIDVIWPVSSNVMTSMGSTTYVWSPASVTTRKWNVASSPHTRATCNVVVS